MLTLHIVALSGGIGSKLLNLTKNQLIYPSNIFIISYEVTPRIFVLVPRHGHYPYGSALYHGSVQTWHFNKKS